MRNFLIKIRDAKVNGIIDPNHKGPIVNHTSIGVMCLNNMLQKSLLKTLNPKIVLKLGLHLCKKEFFPLPMTTDVRLFWTHKLGKNNGGLAF